MGTATEGTLMKILKELQGIRSDLAGRDAPIKIQQNASDTRALAHGALIDRGPSPSPIPLRRDDIRREGPPGLRVEFGTEIIRALHEADEDVRGTLPDPRPGHTWRAVLESSNIVSSRDGGQEYTSRLQLVYTQVQL